MTCTPDDCTGVAAPEHGHLGSCRPDGALAHGAGCALGCDPGYTRAGEQPSCHTGTLTASARCDGDSCIIAVPKRWRSFLCLITPLIYMGVCMVGCMRGHV